MTQSAGAWSWLERQALPADQEMAHRWDPAYQQKSVVTLHDSLCLHLAAAIMTSPLCIKLFILRPVQMS